MKTNVFRLFNSVPRRRIYTGITTDLERRRFKEHESKIGGYYTRDNKVEKILYAEKYQQEARR